MHTQFSKLYHFLAVIGSILHILLYVCGFQKVQLQACGQSRLRDLGMRTDVRAGEGKIAVTLKRRFCDE